MGINMILEEEKQLIEYQLAQYNMARGRDFEKIRKVIYKLLEILKPKEIEVVGRTLNILINAHRANAPYIALITKELIRNHYMNYLAEAIEELKTIEDDIKGNILKNPRVKTILAPVVDPLYFISRKIRFFKTEGRALFNVRNPEELLYLFKHKSPPLFEIAKLHITKKIPISKRTTYWTLIRLKFPTLKERNFQKLWDIYIFEVGAEYLPDGQIDSSPLWELQHRAKTIRDIHDAKVEVDLGSLSELFPTERS